MKFRVELELDPQAINKVDREIARLRDLAAQPAPTSRRNAQGQFKSQAQMKADVVEHEGAERRIKELTERRLALEKALRDLQVEQARQKTAEATADRAAVRTAEAKIRLAQQELEIRRKSQTIGATSKWTPGISKAMGAAGALQGVASSASLTPAQLQRAQALWNQYASMVKKQDEALFNQINANLKRHKAAHSQQIKAKTSFNQTMVALDKQRLKAEQANDKALLALIKNAEKQQKESNRRQEQEQRRHNREQQRLQRQRGGVLDFGRGTVGRGVLSSFSGLGGVNLYGLGAVGLAAAGLKGSMAAYTEIFQLKNVLSGIIQTFGHFKDELGNNVGPGENFRRAQGYSNTVYQKLRRTAIESPLTLKELSEVYTTGSPYLARQGVGFEQQIGIANTIASLGKASGLHVQQIQDDIRNIFSGVLKNAQTFQMAGFTKDDMKKLSTLQGDDFIKFFNSKFQGFQASLKEFAGSFIAQWDNLIDSMYQSGALIGEKIAPAFISFAKDMQASIGAMAADGTLERFGKDLKDVLQALGSAFNFITTSIGTVSTGILSMVTRLVNGVGSLMGQANLAGEQSSFVSNARRGLESWTMQGNKWGPEVDSFVASLTGKNVTGSAKAAMILGGLDTLKKQPNPREFVARYQTDMGELREIQRAFELIQYLETGEGVPDPKDFEQSAIQARREGRTGSFKEMHGHLFGKKRLQYMNELMSIYPDFTPDGGAYSTIRNFGSGGAAGNGFGAGFKEGLISQKDQLAARIGTRVAEYVGIDPALEYLRQSGVNTKLLPNSDRVRPMGGVGPTLSESGGLHTDPAFKKAYDALKKRIEPAVIGVPPAIKPPKTTGFKSSTGTIPKDLTAEIKAIATAEQSVRAIQSRIETNPRKSPSDYTRLQNDTNALYGARVRLIQATEAKRLAESQVVTSFAGKGDPKNLGGLKPHVAIARDLMRKQFGLENIGGYGKRKIQGTDTWSDHAFGLALDPMVPDTPEGKLLGDQIVAWGEANAKALGIKEQIWQQQIRNFNPKTGKWSSWRKMKDRGSRRANHYDHPHTGFFSTGGSSGFVTTTTLNKSTDATGDAASAALDAAMDRDREQLEAAKALTELNRNLLEKKMAYEYAKLENLLGDDLRSTSITTRFGAQGKLLDARNAALLKERGGPLQRAILRNTDPTKYYEIEEAYQRYLGDKKGLGRDANEAKDQEERDYQALVRAKQQETMLRNNNVFRNQMSLRGLRGSDYAGELLNQKISMYEGNLDKGGLYTAMATALLPALYDQKRALEENTAALSERRQRILQQGTDNIFESGLQSHSQNYRSRFEKGMGAIDSMTPSQINKIRGGLGIVGAGMTDDDIKFMLKQGAMNNFSRSGYMRSMNEDQVTGGIENMMGALISGQDPITALTSGFQNYGQQEATQRLLSTIFGNKKAYMKDGKWQKGAFSNDLIAGGGGFAANLLVGTLGQNNYSQEGSQIGGMAASLGLGAALGAWAGPVGILAGGLIGSLFGKKKAPDPNLEQHRKRLEELLQTISNRLKPQEDFYRTIKGTALFGSESRHFGGRSSILGLRASLGAI